jgi:hypothetical protein
LNFCYFKHRRQYIWFCLNKKLLLSSILMYCGNEIHQFLAYQFFRNCGIVDYTHLLSPFCLKYFLSV